MADASAPILDPTELIQFLDQPSPEQAPATGDAVSNLIPLSRQALGTSSVDRIVQQESRPGVPLQVNPSDDESGLTGNFSIWTRFQTARRQNIKDQQNYLETLFPGKVRRSKSSDDFIIEVPDPDTGKTKDVLLNEEQITLGDVAALAAHAPEMAASLIAMSAVGRIASLSKLPALVRAGAGLAAGAAGFKAGEAAQQIETRLEQGQSPEVLSTLAEKGMEIPGQAALDAATAGVFKTAQKAYGLAKGGIGSLYQTAVQKEGLAASEQLAAKYGQELSYSAAEASGMPALAFLEAYAKAKPQSTAIIQGFRDAQIAEQKALAEAMTTKSGTDEEAGSALLKFLEDNRIQKEQYLSAIRQTMTEKESEALTKQLGRFGTIPRQFNPSATGEKLREDFQGLYAGVKKNVGDEYAAAYSVPGAADPVVPTKPILDRLTQLEKQFPTAEATQWFDEYKKTLSKTEAYRDIVQRRSDLWNKIETSPADRETKDFIFGQLSNAMTETLDDASKSIIDPAFRKLIQKANNTYKTSELPFYQKGLRDILIKGGQPGSPENVQLLKRFSESTDLYRRLVEVAGPNSEPVKSVKSAVVDGLLTKSGTTAIDPKYIDAKRFVDNLTDLATNPQTREMFQDIFGKSGKSLVDQAKVLGAIQGNIPKDEAMALLSSGVGAGSKSRLRATLDAQRQLDTVEAKRLINGSVDNVNPEKLINQYADHLTETELKSLATRLQTEAPPLYEQMQDKMVEQILGKAGTYETWTRSSIEKVLNDPKWKPKYRSVLGNKFDDVALFAKALGPRQYAAEIAEGTGALVKGQSIGGLAGIFKFNPRSRTSKVGQILEEVPPWLAWKLTSRLITSGAFREYAGKSTPVAAGSVIPAAVLSGSFLADVASSSESPEIVQSVAMGLRDFLKRNSQTATPKQSSPAITNIDELKAFLEQ